jgi:hypothetical protein
MPIINKPQARISGVEISMCYPIDSNTCTEVTKYTRGQLSKQFKNNLVLAGISLYCTGLNGKQWEESAPGCSFR